MLLVAKDSILVPQSRLRIQIVVREPIQPVSIFLPRWGHNKRITITQCSDLDITIEWNGHRHFSHEKHKYEKCIFSGAQVNMNRSITVVGRYGFWIVESKHVNTYFEGLKCQDTA